MVDEEVAVRVEDGDGEDDPVARGDLADEPLLSDVGYHQKRQRAHGRQDRHEHDCNNVKGRLAAAC